MDAFEKTSVESPNKGHILLEGGFDTNAAANPTKFYGLFIKSVTRTGAGALTVVLHDRFKGMKIISRRAHLSMGAFANSFAQLNTYVASTATLTLTTATAGVAADIAAAADNIVWLSLAMAYSDMLGDGTANYDS